MSDSVFKKTLNSNGNQTVLKILGQSNLLFDKPLIDKINSFSEGRIRFAKMKWNVLEKALILW